MYSTQGLRGFYRGGLNTVLRDAPYAGLFYATYSRLKSNAALGVSGAAFSASLLASVVTQPFDMVRLRMQTRSTTDSATGILRSIVRAEGVSATFRGLSLRILKRSLSGTITWTAFEALLAR